MVKEQMTIEVNQAMEMRCGKNCKIWKVVETKRTVMNKQIFKYIFTKKTKIK